MPESNCIPASSNAAKLEPLPVCLMQEDWISSRILKSGRWEDCRMLIELWKRSKSSPGDVTCPLTAGCF